MNTHISQDTKWTRLGRVAKAYALASVSYLVIALIVHQLGREFSWVSLVVVLLVVTPKAVWPGAAHAAAQRGLTPDAVAKIGLTVFLCCMFAILAGYVL